MRTSYDDVKAIMETGLSKIEVNAVAAVANRIITDKLGSGDTDKLKDIESYMTAHLIAIGPERQAITERVNDIWITYQGDFEFSNSLKTTTYGQMVIFLDDTGKLINAGKQKVKIKSIPQIPENYN